MGGIFSRMHKLHKDCKWVNFDQLNTFHKYTETIWGSLKQDSVQVNAHPSQSVVSGNNKATELANTTRHQEFITFCTEGYDKYSCQTENSVFANFIFNL